MKHKIIQAYENDDGTYTYVGKKGGLSIILGKNLPSPIISTVQLEKIFDESLAVYEAGIREGQRQERAEYAQAAKKIGGIVADFLDSIKAPQGNSGA